MRSFQPPELITAAIQHPSTAVFIIVSQYPRPLLLYVCVSLFEPGPSITSPLRQRAAFIFSKYQNQNLYLDSNLAAAPFPILLSSPFSLPSLRDLKYFRCHLSPELNAICHFWKPLGMLLMTGKCFLEIQPHFSALV